MISLTTPVIVPPTQLRIDHEQPVLLLGSCFSDEIGAKLSAAGFPVLGNPFGTLYNPASIAACLTRALRNEPIDARYLVQHERLWHSWLHHGRFSHPSQDEALRLANESITQTHDFLQQKPLVIVTFGTAWVFELAGDGVMQNKVVANCHKLSPQMFVRRRMTVDEIVELWGGLLHELDCEVLLTVSPIRHMADGAHGNQLSKSTLLLAQESMCAMGCGYFPSYEIAMDELRDYRFYAKDMCHLSDVAIEVIWERFKETYMSTETQQLCRAKERAWRQTQHRQLH